MINLELIAERQCGSIGRIGHYTAYRLSQSIAFIRTVSKNVPHNTIVQVSCVDYPCRYRTVYDRTQSWQASRLKAASEGPACRFEQISCTFFSYTSSNPLWPMYVRSMALYAVSVVLEARGNGAPPRGRQSGQVRLRPMGPGLLRLRHAARRRGEAERGRRSIRVRAAASAAVLPVRGIRRIPVCLLAALAGVLSHMVKQWFSTCANHTTNLTGSNYFLNDQTIAYLKTENFSIPNY